MESLEDRITVSCSSCDKTYSVKRTLAGRAFQCQCGTKVRIVDPDPPIDLQDLAIDEYELEAPVERITTVPVVSTVAVNAETVLPRGTGSTSESSWPLKFVGVFGLLIMGWTILTSLLNVVGLIHYAVQPEADFDMIFILLGLCIFQIALSFLIFRLGRGLLDGERTAVHGLTGIYLILLMGIGRASLTFEDGIFVCSILAGVLSLFYLPPIVVAYANWSHFHDVED